MSKPLVDVDFRPEKPRWEPPQTPPKPNVCLHGALTMPGGGSLVSPPTIRLDELDEPIKRSPELPLPPLPEKPLDSDPVRTLRLLRNRLSFEKIDEMTRPKNTETTEVTEPEVRLPDFSLEFVKSEENAVENKRANSFPRLATWTPFEDEDRSENIADIEQDSLREALTKPTAPVVVRRPREIVFRRPSSNDKNRKACMNSVPSSQFSENVVTSFSETSEGDSSFRETSDSVVSDRSESDSSDEARNGILVTQGLVKNYFKGKLKIPVLKGVNFSARNGEFVSIVGQSGSGKSTLLHLLGTLDKPDAGSIHFDGRRIDNLPVGRRDLLRNRSIGFIFQFYHLLPELTTLENVLSPLMIRESVFGYLMRRREYVERGKHLLEQVGLSHRLKHRPSELSGGEMQRAAIARALISDPKILLADEPTGNLDAASAREIIDLLCRLNQEHRVTIVMVTHDNVIAEVADRTVRMVDGVIVVEKRS